MAWWLRRAADCCRDIESRGRRVLFVGGTPLYLKALLYGLFDGPPADEALRRRLTEEAERLGSAGPARAARRRGPGQRRPAASQRRAPRRPRPGSVGADRPAASAPGRRSGPSPSPTADAGRPVLCLDLPRAGAVRPHRRARPPHDRRRPGRGGPRPAPPAAAAEPGGGAGRRLQGNVRPPRRPGRSGGSRRPHPDAQPQVRQAAADLVPAPAASAFRSRIN